MFKPVFYIVFLYFLSQSFGQENLVPNGDFEEFITCPDAISPYYYVDRAEHWFLPTTGSADYFNSCSEYFDVLTNSYLFSVPQNYIGYQNAHSGNGYAGYYAGNVPANNNYHEYMSVKLSKVLEKNKLYKLSYYVSLADSTFDGENPLQFIDHSGGYFSMAPININDYYRIDQRPQVYNAPMRFLSDSLGWQKIEGIFQANGEEEYLTIGCFYKFEEILFNYLALPDEPEAYVTAYYFVDDVLLEEVNIEFPNVISANGDGINDIAFQYKGVNDLEIIILNRWGDLVLEIDTNEGWAGIDKNGNVLSEGVYFYKAKNKNGDILKTGFIQLIR